MPRSYQLARQAKGLVRPSKGTHSLFPNIAQLLSELTTRPQVAYLSSFPPRQCGIATFTQDVVTAVDRQKLMGRGVVLAINDSPSTYDYPAAVKHQLERDALATYERAADFVNG